MTKYIKIWTIEYAIIILLWIIAFFSPILIMEEYSIDWHTVHMMWAESSIIAFAYIINRFLLVRCFFKKEQYVKYVIALCVLLLLIGLFLFCFDGISTTHSFIKSLSDTIPSPHSGGIPPLGGGWRPYGAPPHSLHTPLMLPPSIVVMTLSAVVIALDMGLSIAIKWIISEQNKAELNRERVSTQLANLQNQVSPHFFMNTLNNIHALVEIDPQRAQKTIIELSGLMDYLLYESSNIERVSLQRELDFTKSYINLMRLRYPKRVTINYSHSLPVPSIKIPPLLFLNFIENTFKYGVDYTKESFIKIHFDFVDNELTMVTENSNHASTVKSKKTQGIGISNSRKRLKLLYGNKFTLDIKDSKEIYHVTLKIPTL